MKYTESDVCANFIQYLKNKGYPENSIAVEYRVADGARIDIAILDLDYNTPIQIFELKKIKDRTTEENGRSQLKKYLKLLGNEYIPAYLVFPGKNEKEFEIIRVNDATLNVEKGKESHENKEAEVFDSLAMNYSGQKMSRRAEKVSKISEKKKATVDLLKVTCWILAGVTLVLLVLKKFGCICLDNNDLALLGGVILLILAPSAQKIKILGVEYERAIGKNEK